MNDSPRSPIGAGRLWLTVAGVLAAGACGGGNGAPRSPGSGGTSGSGGAGATVGADGGADDSPSGPDADARVPPALTLTVLDHVGIGSQGSTGWTTTGSASADFDWKAGPFAQVRLVTDLESACYPFEKWATDPPPLGQNWPADCDAFDRNFNIFVDDTRGAIPFEVVHAITPFGGPEHLDVDLTDLANALPGPHRLRVELGSFSDSAGLVTGSNAGWTVSVHIDVSPGPAPRHVLAAIPLFAGALMAADAPPVISWNVPAGASGGRIEYRTSGHGQGPRDARCVGPAEEFCDRRHLIFVDGAMVDNLDPYRQDCQTLCTTAHFGAPDAGLDYCRENPCGDMASVRAPRANWCPGSMTPPFSWDSWPQFAVPGPHTFSFQISGIAQGGTWLASAIYYATGG